MIRPDDDLFDDFRKRFFTLPNDLEGDRIAMLMHHPWYVRIQRARFGRATTVPERWRIEELLADAQSRFALRLWKNPMLGIQVEQEHLLPGFIRNHARSIASAVLRSRVAVSETHALLEDLPDNASCVGRCEYAELVDFLNRACLELLDEELEMIARFRWFLRWPERAVARYFGCTRHEVRACEQRAREAIATRAVAAGVIDATRAVKHSAKSHARRRPSAHDACIS